LRAASMLLWGMRASGSLRVLHVTRSMTMTVAIHIGTVEDLMLGSSLHTMQVGVEDGIVLVQATQVKPGLGRKCVMAQMWLAMVYCLAGLWLKCSICTGHLLKNRV